MILGSREKDRRSGFVVNGPDKGGELPVRICDMRAPAGFDGFGVAQANAALIAAGPDMLAALKFCLSALVNMTTADFSRGADKPARDMAAAAIAKAEGGA